MKVSDRVLGAASPTWREREAAALAHSSALLVFFFPLGGLAGPAAVLLREGGRSAFVARHAAAALLWQGAATTASYALRVAGPLHGFDPSVHILVVAGAAAVSLAFSALPLLGLRV